MDQRLGVRAATAAMITLLASGGLASTRAHEITQGRADGRATTYIGVLPSEPPARVAVVVEGDSFVAYVCGATDDFNRHASAWFKGEIRNRRIESTANGKTLSAELGDGSLRGTLSAEGKTREFTAKPVAANGLPGLYRATREQGDDRQVLGWIVDEKRVVVGGCHGSKSSPVALKPAKQPPQVKAKANVPPKETAENGDGDLQIRQVDDESGEGVEGEKVQSAVTLPPGKPVRAAKAK
jgi:hypothetical protein